MPSEFNFHSYNILIRIHDNNRYWRHLKRYFLNCCILCWEFSYIMLGFHNIIYIIYNLFRISTYLFSLHDYLQCSTHESGNTFHLAITKRDSTMTNNVEVEPIIWYKAVFFQIGFEILEKITKVIRFRDAKNDLPKIFPISPAIKYVGSLLSRFVPGGNSVHLINHYADRYNSIRRLHRTLITIFQ